MTQLPDCVDLLAARLADLGGVSELWVAGSLATGDYAPGVSDIDLVAVVDGLSREREMSFARIHEELDRGQAAGADLGCVYVAEDELNDSAMLHPTWTHGRFVRRTLSGITRAELVRNGLNVYGRTPTELLPSVTDDEVREAARAEILGYWAMTVRRPTQWLYPVIADLGLTSMARGRFALEHGQLLTKSEAIEVSCAPDWLKLQLKARRRGEQVVSPRIRTAWIAWRDARKTVRAAAAPRPLE